MFDPGKTVWTSHTDKALKGKIVKKDDDNADHYIVLHKDGQHAVHQDHIHAKEEYAKYMLEQLELYDAEQIDELSKTTLKSYIKKAKKNFKANTSYDDHDGYEFLNGVTPQKMMKRSETIDAAKAQLKK